MYGCLLTAVITLVLACWPVAAQKAPHGNQIVTRIAFGSCADQEQAQPIWEAIRRFRPELFIFAGDNVYGDSENGKYVADDARLPAVLRAAYEKAGALEDYSRLRRTTPHLATWDDHDYGKNDAGADYVNKDDSQSQFIEFWKLPANDPRRTRPGVYHAETFGPPGKRVQVILLDTRYFRSPLKKGLTGYTPDSRASATMLGSEQWSWLADQLKEKDDLRIIVSSIQVLADDHKFERWGNFPGELKRLLDLLESGAAATTVFLSGDRHLAALYKQPAGSGSQVFEATSSGLTRSFTSALEKSSNQIGAIHGAINFGTLDIDWWSETVKVSIRSVNGEPVRTAEFSFRQMTLGK